MSRFRKKLTCTLIVVAILITTMSIAYAALSATLTITGSAEVQATNWDVQLGQYDTPLVTGSATYTNPQVEGTIIKDYTVSLKKPGDAVLFYFDIFNYSDTSAEVISLTSSTPTCTSSTGNEDDAKAICDNLNIEFYIRNANIGDHIGPYESYVSHSTICGPSDTATTNYAQVAVKISLNNTVDAMVGSNVSISNLKNEIILTPSDKKCSFYQCFVAGTKVLTKEGYKNIEDIKVGDYVYSINKFGQRELKIVYYKYNKTARTLQKIQVGREIITVTPEHKIYVIGKGYIRADSIEKGDRLYGVKDGFVVSNQTFNYKEEIPVYNIEVHDNHNYLVTESEFLVHNQY